MKTMLLVVGVMTGCSSGPQLETTQFENTKQCVDVASAIDLDFGAWAVCIDLDQGVVTYLRRKQ